MTQVLTLAAIATCAANGHRWHLVRSWHAVGYEECHVCGETRNQGFLFGDLPPTAPRLASPDWESSPMTKVMPKSMPPVGNTAPGVRPSRKGRNGNKVFSTEEEAALYPRAIALVDNPRDKDILYRLSQGQTLGNVGALYHIHMTRVHQIKKKAFVLALAEREASS